ncbi:MAG: hypothetical protein QOF20_139 [Acidimicrobiaceae bacterium]|jgi:hypothetical protein|nr:hypothetical protein [Acidimicrobiaceae bacterium]MDQ1365132.1 hypothetical protein [Acidimicrobiaceae bacterium]MDQ1367786.1 hypothetical protein [Acidimicrobiaceae bacterium]MDQ1399176.1 hypothetical protein [Acidimicrobiaceae bacterium]MDQ1412770.1 hypothetical protein [Acidimicrobiaceae bacterium]
MADPNPRRVALYAASEVLVPGASNLLEGNIKQGVLHALAGVAAGAIYGPAGLLLVAADSIHKSVTGENLYDRLGLFKNLSKETEYEGAVVADAVDEAPVGSEPPLTAPIRRRPPRA